MRVLVVTPWYPDDLHVYAGAFVARDVRLLAERHEVEVVHLVAPQHDDGGPDRVVRDGIALHRVPMRPSAPRDWRAAGRAIRAASAGVDLVHTHAATSLWPTALAFPIGRRRPTWVHTEHSSTITARTAPGPRGLVTRTIRRALFSRPDLVVAVSDHLAGIVRAIGRRPPVTVVPNGIDLPVPTPPRRPQDGRFELVAVAGLTDVKRPLLAVRALARLVERGHDAHLTWVGDGPLRQEVEALAAQLGVADRVRLPGAVPPERVAESLIAADVFVLPTRGETFGVAIAEAIANGRPVVVGAVGGQREFVSPVAGELVDGDDPERYADALERVRRLADTTAPEAIAATLTARLSPAARADAYDAAYRAATAAHAR